MRRGMLMSLTVLVLLPVGAALAKHTETIGGGDGDRDTLSFAAHRPRP